MSYDENIANQTKTPKSASNVLIDKERPYKGGRQYHFAPKMGWLSLQSMGSLKHHTDIANSKAKRRAKRKAQKLKTK